MRQIFLTAVCWLCLLLLRDNGLQMIETGGTWCRFQQATGKVARRVHPLWPSVTVNKNSVTVVRLCLYIPWVHSYQNQTEEVNNVWIITLHQRFKPGLQLNMFIYFFYWAILYQLFKLDLLSMKEFVDIWLLAKNVSDSSFLQAVLSWKPNAGRLTEKLNIKAKILEFCSLPMWEWQDTF